MGRFIGYVWYKGTPFHEGEKVGVNWFRKGKLGISFLTSTGAPDGEGKVVTKDEVEFRYGDISDYEKKKDVREESYEDLKKRLEKIRDQRRAIIRGSAPKKKKKKKKKKDPKKDALAALEKMDPEVIKQILAEKEDSDG